jgi:predicted Zn-dependent protease with MMP-like domain
MNTAEFETVVRETIEALPDWVRQALQNIDVLVVDAPSAETEGEHGDLLGLYVGRPLTERGAIDSDELPDIIYIYRLPHLALGYPRDELRDEIARTVIHEIAHYFGIDDYRLDEMGWG